MPSCWARSAECLPSFSKNESRPTPLPALSEVHVWKSGTIAGPPIESNLAFLLSLVANKLTSNLGCNHPTPRKSRVLEHRRRCDTNAAIRELPRRGQLLR